MHHILTFKGDNNNNSLMRKLFELRKEIFIEELSWSNMRDDDNQERDQFDDIHTTYYAITDDEKNVIGCTRARPTIYEHMNNTVFQELCSYDGPPIAPSIAEASRICISKDYRLTRRSAPFFLLNQLMVEHLYFSGYSEVTFSAHLDRIPFLNKFGYELRILGPVIQYENRSCVAVISQINDRVLNKMSRFTRVESVLDKIKNNNTGETKNGSQTQRLARN